MKNWRKKGAQLITCLWVFIFPWLAPGFEVRTLLIMGVGAILALLLTVIWMLDEILSKQKKDVAPVEQFRLPPFK